MSRGLGRQCSELSARGASEADEAGAEEYERRWFRNGRNVALPWGDIIDDPLGYIELSVRIAASSVVEEISIAQVYGITVRKSERNSIGIEELVVQEPVSRVEQLVIVSFESIHAVEAVHRRCLAENVGDTAGDSGDVVGVAVVGRRRERSGSAEGQSFKAEVERISICSEWHQDQGEHRQSQEGARENLHS